MSGISVWNEHSPKIESALAENKVVARITLNLQLLNLIVVLLFYIFCVLYPSHLDGGRFEAYTQGVI